MKCLKKGVFLCFSFLSAESKWNILHDRVPEIVFWHIPSTAYKVVAPKFDIRKPCVGSINKESVAAQELETGIMDLLANRTSVKVMSYPVCYTCQILQNYLYGTKIKILKILVVRFEPANVFAQRLICWFLWLQRYCLVVK